MKHALLIVYSALFIFAPNVIFAQQGNYYLRHFSSAGNNSDNINFDILQDKDGIINIANRQGLWQFDGKNWSQIETPSAIFSLALDSENNIYLGGAAGFGILSRDEQFNLKYKSLSSQVESATNITKILYEHNSLYAINDENLYVHHKDSVKTISSGFSGAFLDLIEYNGQVYVNTSNSGLQQIEGNHLQAPQNLSFDKESTTFIARLKESSKYIIGTDDNELIYLNGSRAKKLSFKKDGDYLLNSGIETGIFLSDTLAVLSSLKGGVIFINPLKSEIVKIINYQSGLPDNEVYALATDDNYGVWVAHSEGLTRIAPDLPFKSFSQYAGLKGNVLSAVEHEGQLFVGTSTGVYYLEEVKSFDETIRIIKKPTIQEKTVIRDDKKKKGGLFGFLKKKNKESSEEEPPKGAQPQYKRLVEKELKSITYEYKPINNIGSKTSLFETDGNRLFCGGLDGLYEIKDKKAFKISDEAIRYFTISPNKKKIFASTYNHELKVYDYREDFHELNIFSQFRDDVHYIFEDHMGKIWYCSMEEIYCITFNNDEIADTEEYNLENPYYDETYGVAQNDTIFFINTKGIFFLNKKTNDLELLKKGEDIQDYFHGNGKSIWLSSKNAWKKLGSHASNKNFTLLNLFHDIKYIKSNPQSNEFWVITEGNDLYQVSAKKQNFKTKNYKLLLKKIQSGTTSYGLGPELKFDQQNNKLAFEFIEPEYSGILDIQYQYKLEGLNREWSDWSPDHNVIDFPYLPDGKYTLHVRSKDILGTISEADPISFQIKPPYWKRPWFYVLEFLGLALLLFASINVKKLGDKYHLVSQLLAVLALVIIIEFIQTIAESKFTLSSPVIDFIIQVIIAIIILPIERLLRRYIFREKEVKVLEFVNLKKRKSEPESND
ncbi:triple tyrosine motif-containing protein [Fulvivirga ligni]|uniref:triple tyrosine motif-containing protein n=1 Tax=Fulvivirga ligni TaxID=2904246 RepID=UPI001F44FE2F|nr:triple tyrosine motif-containing protein [Fulvivirga ligni]UII22154.1 hypothetical protein LVD16_02775 [Fulvivirga ligni]